MYVWNLSRLCAKGPPTKRLLAARCLRVLSVPGFSELHLHIRAITAAIVFVSPPLFCYFHKLSCRRGPSSLSSMSGLLSYHRPAGSPQAPHLTHHTGPLLLVLSPISGTPRLSTIISYYTTLCTTESSNSAAFCCGVGRRGRETHTPLSHLCVSAVRVCPCVALLLCKTRVGSQAGPIASLDSSCWCQIKLCNRVVAVHTSWWKHDFCGC